MVISPTGSVVLVPFPFSDLSRAKLRPAVVLANIDRGDHLLCQVTSNPYGDASAVALDETAFARGSLRVTSYARPGKLLTASDDLIVGEVGALTPTALARIVNAVVAIAVVAGLLTLVPAALNTSTPTVTLASVALVQVKAVARPLFTTPATE